MFPTQSKFRSGFKFQNTFVVLSPQLWNTSCPNSGIILAPKESFKECTISSTTAKIFLPQPKYSV